jgi:hypothetical protein
VSSAQVERDVPAYNPNRYGHRVDLDAPSSYWAETDARVKAETEADHVVAVEMNKRWFSHNYSNRPGRR